MAPLTARRLEGLIARVLDVSEHTILPESGVGTIPSWDSLRHLQVVVSVEEVFGVQFTTREITVMRSVGDFRYNLRTYGVDE